MSGLSQTVTTLQQQLREKERYVAELETSQTPIKPNKPAILSRSREDKELEQRDTILRLERHNNDLQLKLA